MEGILDVALSHDAEVTDYLQRRLSQHVVLLVGEGPAGGHDN